MRLLIFLVFNQYGLAFKYGVIFEIIVGELHFLIPGITIANQTRQ